MKMITGWFIYNFTVRDINCDKKSRNKKCRIKSFVKSLWKKLLPLNIKNVIFV